METSDAVTALTALAQETRLDIFRLLVQAGNAGLPAGRIAELLRLPAATLSFHLSQLKQAGLVTFQRKGRSLVYAAEYPAMNRLMNYLTEHCCQGDGADCGGGVCEPTAPRTTSKGVTRHEARARTYRR